MSRWVFASCYFTLAICSRIYGIETAAPGADAPNNRTDAFLASLGISPSTIPLLARRTGGSQLACAVLVVGRQGEVVRPSETVAYDSEREAHW